MTAHVALSILVWHGFVKASGQWLAGTIALHSLMDMVAVFVFVT